MKTGALVILHPFKSGGDEGSRTLIVRFTRPTLCYPIELHRLPEIGGLGGIQTLTRSLQDFYAVAYITSPGVWWLWVELNHQPFAYETKALPLELHSRDQG
jgi:hypothetical protein